MIWTRRTLVVFAIFTAAATVASIGITQAFGGHARTYAFVAPTVAADVHPVQTPEAVEGKVLDDLGTDSHVTKVDVVADRAHAQELVPGLGNASAADAAHDGALWVVRAFGLFKPVTTPPGAPEITTPRSGWVIVDDSTNTVVGFGWP